MTEFLYIKNEDWHGSEEWKPYHIKNEHGLKLFQYEFFYSLEEDYSDRFFKLIINKILTYD